jgi:tripartite-type tricarboxylate transporter receptor subunit TctC
LNKEVSAVLALPEVKAQLEPQLIFPISTSADSFGAFIREDTERWQRVVKDVGLQPN